MKLEKIIPSALLIAIVAFSSVVNAKEVCKNETATVDVLHVEELSNISHAMKTVSDCSSGKCIFHNEIYQANINVYGYEVTYKLDGRSQKKVFNYDPTGKKLKVHHRKCALETVGM